MPINEKLLTVIRVLQIILLVVIIYAAVQGALVAKVMKETVETRLANNEFPLPMNGLTDFLKEAGAQSMPLIKSEDSDVQRQLSKVQEICAGSDVELCRKELVLLQNLFSQKGMTQESATVKDMIASLDKKDLASLQANAQKLQKQLS